MAEDCEGLDNHSNQSSASPKIQFEMGELFEKGEVVLKDLEKAKQWYERAAYQDFIPAQLNLSELLLEESQGGQNPAAIHWLHRASQMGSLKAHTKLGDIYLRGDGVKKDPQRAITHYREAAKQNCVLAHYRLGEVYLLGKGIKINKEFAYHHFYQAALFDYPQAQFQLGLMNERGIGTIKDVGESVYWYTKAANHQHIRALYKLGLAYSKGLGCPKDIAKAHAYFSMASLNGARLSKLFSYQLNRKMDEIQKERALALYMDMRASIG